MIPLTDMLTIFTVRPVQTVLLGTAIFGLTLLFLRGFR